MRFFRIWHSSLAKKKFFMERTWYDKPYGRRSKVDTQSVKDPSFQMGYKN